VSVPFHISLFSHKNCNQIPEYILFIILDIGICNFVKVTGTRTLDLWYLCEGVMVMTPIGLRSSWLPVRSASIQKDVVPQPRIVSV
jgi:hypothetical protein